MCQILAAGIDEAGRGCLAGPVVAAAVILPHPFLIMPGLADSKLLSAKAREKMAAIIKKSAIAWSLGVVWQKRIDEINILQATFEAMARAVSTLCISPSVLLVDGGLPLPYAVLKMAWRKQDLPRQKNFVRGDRYVPAISAASVLAKVCRDQLMRVLARKWPQYGFDSHKGYGTRAHLQALREYGPCRLHRLTFRGVMPRMLPGMNIHGHAS